MQAICKALFPCLSALVITELESSNPLRHLCMSEYMKYVNHHNCSYND